MTRFAINRKPDGSTVLAWTEGAAALHGLELCAGVATVFVTEPLPPPAIQKRVRDDGTLEYGIPADLLEGPRPLSFGIPVRHAAAILRALQTERRACKAEQMRDRFAALAPDELARPAFWNPCMTVKECIDQETATATELDAAIAWVKTWTATASQVPPTERKP